MMRSRTYDRDFSLDAWNHHRVWIDEAGETAETRIEQADVEVVGPLTEDSHDTQ